MQTPSSQPSSIDDKLTRAAHLVEEADAIVIAAGAGMGVDSGLPDFRGNAGFWEAYPALQSAGIDFQSIACPDTFRSDARLAWGFYGHRLNLYRRTIPHDGFQILKRWADTKPHGYFVFTSNVDGQFQRAGFDDEHIYECHGSIHYLQCVAAEDQSTAPRDGVPQNCSVHFWCADQFEPLVDDENCRLQNDPPICPNCGGPARPNVLMFDDYDWIDRRARIQQRSLERWIAEVSRPVVIELGAGKAIPSVREFSESVVGHFGGRLIRINPLHCDVSTGNDVGLPVRALTGLQAIDQRLTTG